MARGEGRGGAEGFTEGFSDQRRGRLGSNLADTLAQNHGVAIIDNLATGRRVNVEHLQDHPRVTFIEGSINDLDLPMETFPGVDGIFHQAVTASPASDGVQTACRVNLQSSSCSS